MTYTINGNYHHTLRKNDNLDMQNDFIFFDTETNRIKIDKDTEYQTLKLGWCIYWNRSSGKTEYLFFETIKQFKSFVYEKLESVDCLYLLAHNMDFDIKIIQGYTEFIVKDGWNLSQYPYVEGLTFILQLEKNGKKLIFLSTTNFFDTSLDFIGEEILKLPKLKIDLDNCSHADLKKYCLRDTEIIYRLIKSLIQFLTDNNLSKFRNTKASLGFNIFKHKFYDPKKNPILIHNWVNAVKLERHSYHGGISDCFKIGNFTEKLYKLDINSMYPYIMKTKELPNRLLLYKKFKNGQNVIEDIKKYLNDYLVIVNCQIFLPSEYAYILTPVKMKYRNSVNRLKTEKKTIFLCGTFNVSLCSPEFNFVLKYGKVLKINEIAVYQKGFLFNDFVDYFYNKRLEFKKEGNVVYAEFCKFILNSLSGKFGQKRTDMQLMGHIEEPKFESVEIYNEDIDQVEKYKYMGYDFYRVLDTDDNAFDSFVAVIAFITSYARMYLVNLILTAGRKNVYYTDTDCLIVNEQGYKNLQKFISNDQLGCLKIEGISNDSTFIAPKMYTFNEITKIKGIKKKAKLLSETKTEFVFEQPQFQRFKSAFNDNALDKQIVRLTEKVIQKSYNKGTVKNGEVIPYEVKK